MKRKMLSVLLAAASDGFEVDNPPYQEGFTPKYGLQANFYVYSAGNGWGEALTEDYYTYVTTTYMENVNMDNLDPILGEYTGQQDYAAIRFIGKIKTSVTGPHTFYMKGDNGFTLTINGETVIDHWQNDWDKEQTGTIDLVADTYYDFQVDYFEESGGSNLHLWWDNGSGREVVPNEALTVPSTFTGAPTGDWTKQTAALTTVWYDEIDETTIPLDEYPRPQLVRDDWINLNGLWQFQSATSDTTEPAVYSKYIMVPYPMESALSGIKQHHDYSWYKREFTVPEEWRASGQRVILHFEAVDWRCAVYVNGEKLTTHEGGYEAFSVDITDALVDGETQEVVVSVFDDTGENHTRGKQVNNPNSIWYTACSGIWGTVWMEPVAENAHIDTLKMDTDIDTGVLGLTINTAGSATATADVTILAEDQVVLTATDLPVGEVNDLTIPEDLLYLWSPDSPFLYDLEITLKVDGQVVDTVGSYFGMRKIEIRDTGEVVNGQKLMATYLNNERIFMMGFLDQGYWPDTIYTPPTDEAMMWEIQAQKDLGYNMIRKHIKVESKRWYYYADKLGMLVWQDQPAAFGDESQGTNMPFEDYKAEMEQMVKDHWNHPSIVMWICYNEAWGQHGRGQDGLTDPSYTIELANAIKELDPSRLVSCATGWQDAEAGDIIDSHSYPNPGTPNSGTRARVCGEFGGLQYELEEHLWSMPWGGYTEDLGSSEALMNAYEEKMEMVKNQIQNSGMSGAVYTQFTDVEIEINGIYTYDRKVLKVDQDWMYTLNQDVIHSGEIVKEGLEGALARVELLDEEKYASESFDKVTAAKATAQTVLDQPDATQLEVYEATQALLESIDGLVLEGVEVVDKTVLNETIKEAQKLVAADYTDETWAPVATAKAAAAKVKYDKQATQAQVDEAVAALREALDKLVRRPIEWGDLDAAIAEAQALQKRDYTFTGWDDVQSALAEAIAVKDVEGVRQAQVDSAEKALNDALNTLVRRVEGELDQSWILGLSEKAEALDPNLYTESSFEAVTQALQAAQDIYYVKPFGPEAVENGSFETGDLTGWTLESLNDKPPVVKEWDQAKDGKYHLAASEKGPNYRISQTLTGLSDGTYLFSMWIRGKVDYTGSSAYMSATVNGQEQQVFMEQQEWDAPWTNYTMELEVTGGSCEIEIYMENGNDDPSLDLISFREILPSTPPTQADVDQVADTLEAALNALVLKPADKEALKAAIERAGTYDETAYPEDLWAPVAEALAKATALDGDEMASQADVDEAAQAIVDAIAALEPGKGEPDEQGLYWNMLNVYLEQAALVATDYTTESWAKLQEAVDAAALIEKAAEQAASGGSVGPVDYVTNGSFENDLEGWTATDVNGNTAVKTIDSDPQDGTKALDTGKVDEGNNHRQFTISQTFEVPAGTYTLSGWVRGAVKKGNISPEGEQYTKLTVDCEGEKQEFAFANQG